MTKEPESERATEQMVVYIAPSKHVQAKILAVKRKTSVSAIVRDLLDAELEKEAAGDGR